ncbi:unnamed protein product [Musa acuminata subsp. burmannicoides]
MIVIKDHLINPNPTRSHNSIGIFSTNILWEGSYQAPTNREVKRVLFALAVANSHVISYVAPE